MERPDVGTKEDLARYRIETAKEALKDAKLLFDNNSLKSSNNRAYYAAFNAINAVHALDGEAYKRHKDAIGNFNKKYVRSEQFPREIGHRLAELEEIRHASDYDDFYIATKDEAIEQIETAEMLISKIEEYISNRSGKESK